MILVVLGYALSFKIIMNNSKEEGSSVTDLWIQFNLVYSCSPSDHGEWLMIVVVVVFLSWWNILLKLSMINTYLKDTCLSIKFLSTHFITLEILHLVVYSGNCCSIENVRNLKNTLKNKLIFWGGKVLNFNLHEWIFFCNK